MKSISIDINADIGEGINNELQLIPLLSSCNIACGGHAGDRETMQRCVDLALLHGVKIGAHPSFPDRDGFGRNHMVMPHDDLFQELQTQINKLVEILARCDELLHHVKPHGALYNLAVKDKTIASVIVDVVKNTTGSPKLYVPNNSVIEDVAIEAGLSVVFEAFADRHYNNDLTLVSRDKHNAIITNEKDMLNHVKGIIMSHKVSSLNGIDIPITAETICVHGDTPKAVELLKYLRHNLINFGIKIE